MSLSSLPPLREILTVHGLEPRKSLGQHFLLDGNVTDKILRLSGSVEGLHVIEIGPGPGGLTRSILAASPASLTAIEKDDRCQTILAQLAAISPVLLTVLAADGLKVSLPQTVSAPRAIIANLPYNVGTPMLVNWLRDIAADPAAYAFMSLMFQKEVAERIYAPTNSDHYGRLAVLCQWLCDCENLMDLPARAFTPPPKVDSAVVKLTPHAAPLPARFETVERLTAAAFGQRRKMLRSSLKSLGLNVETLLQAAEIDPTRRAETVSPEEFLRLATLMETQQHRVLSEAEGSL